MIKVKKQHNTSEKPWIWVPASDGRPTGVSDYVIASNGISQVFAPSLTLPVLGALQAVLLHGPVMRGVKICESV